MAGRRDRSGDALRVTAVRRGGFAGVPIPYDVEAATLGEAGARRLLELVQASGVLEGTAAIVERAGTEARDLIEWEITVTLGEASRSLRRTEDALAPALEELIEFVTRLAASAGRPYARPSRRAPKDPRGS